MLPKPNPPRYSPNLRKSRNQTTLLNYIFVWIQLIHQLVLSFKVVIMSNLIMIILIIIEVLL